MKQVHFYGIFSIDIHIGMSFGTTLDKLNLKDPHQKANYNKFSTAATLTNSDISEN